MDTPLAVRHSSGMYIAHPRGIHAALFLTYNLKFFQDFRTSKPKRSKRLSICLVPPFLRSMIKRQAARDCAKVIKTIRVFTKTTKEYQYRLTKADIIKNQLRTFVFGKQREKKPDTFWCRLQWAMLPTIVDTSADYSEQCCRLQSAPKHLNIKI